MSDSKFGRIQSQGKSAAGWLAAAQAGWPGLGMLRVMCRGGGTPACVGHSPGRDQAMRAMEDQPSSYKHCVAKL